MSITLLQINAAMAADTITSGQATTQASMNYWDLLQKGGWIMVPIVFLFLLSIYIFLNRLIVLRQASREDVQFMNRIKDYISDNKIEAARTLCHSTQSPVARMIEKGISRLGRPMKEIEESIEIVGKLEIYNLEKHLTVLGVVAGIAPMFGFIGTIAGVIKIFYNISLADNISIGIIAGGLYQKMISSASGLLVGILAFVAYHILNIMVERIVHKLEFSVMNFMDILHEPIKK
jgi:biopolymer transport protein ExbB